MGSDSSSKWLGYSKILEPKEVFIQNGSPLVLRCEISLMLTHNFSLEVWWLHEDTQILAQVGLSSFFVVKFEEKFYETFSLKNPELQ